MKVDPLPGELLTLASPPWARAIQRTIANPSPLPPGSDGLPCGFSGRARDLSAR